MIKKKLAIFGNSLMAEVVYYYFKEFTDYEISCFVSEKKYIKNDKLKNIRVLPLEKFLKLNKNDFTIFIAIGYSDLNKKREFFFNFFKDRKYKLTNFIHPNASCFHHKMGKNNFIMDNVSVNPFTSIGNNNILWSNSIIGHHNNIGNNNFFSGNSTISGNCKILNNCFFGVNSSTKDGLHINSFCFIDANQYVSKKLKSKSFYNLQVNPKLKINSFQVFRL
jgi:sugar O-acyltransferase (sialic acid O-acetyltransferase NeuD family)|tara:strand:+ start:57 stop:719 length:663 start_codon:yes stop_codon:yes gene_type:complete